MRVTNSTLTQNFLGNLSNNLGNMSKYQNQLSSGKEVFRPSDNPMLISKIMALRNNVMQNAQYKLNISDSIGWIETQDTTLNNLTGALQRMRELVVYGANGSLSSTDRSAIKDEMAMQIRELNDILNTNFDGRYIFGGQDTMEMPFSVDEDNLLKYESVEGKNIFREISQGVLVNLITDGSRIVKLNDSSSTQNHDLGMLLKNIVNATADSDTNALSGELLKDIDLHIDNILGVRSSIGAMYNRLHAAKSRNEGENINLRMLLSEREDIDLAEKYMEYTVMSTVYQASLSAGAKILQPSLLDYLR